MEKEDLEATGKAPLDPLEETEKEAGASAEKDRFPSHVTISEIRRDLPMYDILSIVGKGSSGIVYRGVHSKLGRNVAIKMLRPEYFRNQAILESFRKEAQILSRIKHENVASVYDFIEANNRFYLVMELVDGKGLPEISKDGRLDERTILKIMQGLLEGIRFTHNKNILHLDLKPSNILLNEYAEPLIIDFGISRFKSDMGGLEKEAKVLGTPFYMSPEQYVRSSQLVDHRSDIYSLGVIFYQLLTGELPFYGKNFKEVRTKVILEDPKRPSQIREGLSLDLEAIVLKMLRKNPWERYADAQAVIEDMARYRNGEPVKAQKYDLFYLLLNWMKRNFLISLLSFLVLLVCFFFLIYYSYKMYQETPHWKAVFSENFNEDFEDRWTGYSGILEGFLEPVSKDLFNKYFNQKIKTASFKKDLDLALVTSETFDENMRLAFTVTMNPEADSHFGFFIDASIPDPALGYIIHIRNNEIQLLRDNLSSTPLWVGKFEFRNDQTYFIEFQVVDGGVRLSINNKKMIDFQDFVTWFSKKEYRFGFFAKSLDLEIDNVNLCQLNTALLITPLNIGNRFFQLGRFEDAIEEYSRVITKYPENKIALDAYYLRGLAKQKKLKFVEAMKDFDTLLEKSGEHSVKGKSWYQKGVCELYLGELKEACRDFDEAKQVYDIPSLRSIVLSTLITFCRDKIKSGNSRSITESEVLLAYLLTQNVPSRITFVDIPKNIVLYYFDNGEYEKSIKNLDLLIQNYQSRRDVVAFALWKKGRAYMEMANAEKTASVKEQDLKKAIYWFKQVLVQCPEVRFYNYYATDELAGAYRANGDYKQAIEFEKQKTKFKDIFSD